MDKKISQTIKYAVLILLVTFIVTFTFIIFFSEKKPTESLTTPSKTVTEQTAEHPANTASSTITVETKQVELAFFKDDSLVGKYKEPLFEVTKNQLPDKTEKVVKVKVDGNKIKDIISKVAETTDMPAAQKDAEVIKIKDNFSKIVRPENRAEVDKTKTLKLLEEMIKEDPAKASFDVALPMKENEGERTFNSKMKELGFNTLLAEASTVYEASQEDAGRNINLKLASDKIDGVIIEPGQTFSFNKIVGNRTAANGYKDAGVISRGRVIPGIGGGICQVTTTLYQASIYSGLEIKERYNHSIYEGIDYAKRGLDAAVAWGYKDFVLKNTLPVPVLITSKTGKGTVDIALYAPEKPFEKIEIETKKEVKHPFKTVHKRNTNLPKGEVKIQHPGVDGYTIEVYRTITSLDGKTSTECLSKDRYLTYNRIEERNN